MAMEHRFDRLAKSVSGAISRREALRRAGQGIGLAVLAAFGLGAGDPSNCGHCCQTVCRTFDIPPRGPEMALCIRSCHETGIAIGPLGEVSTTCAPLCTDS